MLSLTRVGATTSRSVASASTRALGRPSSSPSTRAASPPCRMRPGAIQSADQLTRQPTVRRSPTAASSNISVGHKSLPPVRSELACPLFPYKIKETVIEERRLRADHPVLTFEQ